MIKKLHLLFFLVLISGCFHLKAQVRDDITIKTQIVNDSLTNSTYGKIIVTIPENIESAPYSCYLFADKFLGKLIDSQKTMNNEVTFKVSDLKREYVISVKNTDASFLRTKKVKF